MVIHTLTPLQYRTQDYATLVSKKTFFEMGGHSNPACIEVVRKNGNMVYSTYHYNKYKE